MVQHPSASACFGSNYSFTFRVTFCFLLKVTVSASDAAYSFIFSLQLAATCLLGSVFNSNFGSQGLTVLTLVHITLFSASRLNSLTSSSAPSHSFRSLSVSVAVYACFTLSQLLLAQLLQYQLAQLLQQCRTFTSVFRVNSPTARSRSFGYRLQLDSTELSSSSA